MRHEFSDKGEAQLRAFFAIVDRLANNMGRLAIAVEELSKQQEKEKEIEEIRA